MPRNGRKSEEYMNHLPIDYIGVTRAKDGHEGAIDLEAAGWRDRHDVRNAQVFTLCPKPDSALPTVCVILDPLPDGTPKQLVYSSRVFGNIFTSADEQISSEENQHDLFRLYCIGWKATIAGREIKSVSWVYPCQPDGKGRMLTGSVVMADEPILVNELIEHYSTLNAPHAEAPPAAEIPIASEAV